MAIENLNTGHWIVPIWLWLLESGPPLPTPLLAYVEPTQLSQPSHDLELNQIINPHFLFP